MGRAKSAKKLPPISIRLDPDVRTGIEALAKADDRSLSDYINRALRRHVETEARRKERTRPAKISRPAHDD